MRKDEIIYSPQKRDFLPGHRYANPQFFDGVATDVTSVIVVGNRREIIDAYRMRTKASITVVRDLDELNELFERRTQAQASERAAKIAPKRSSAKADELTLPDVGEMASMAFPVLRGIAEKLTDEPIGSRKQAEALIAEARAARAKAA